MEQANSKEFERFWRETQLVRANVSNETFALLQPCVFHAGEYLYTEGEATDMLYLMLEGSCKVFKLLENGKSLLLCLYDDVQVLGEFELFSDPVTKSNVQALRETYCYALPLEKYRAQLLADNLFLQFVLRQTCAKVHRNNNNTARNLLYPLEQRLAAYILKTQDGGRFFANYTMLAEYLGCSLRHLLRTLHTFCTRGLLQKAARGYLLSNAAGLQALAKELEW